MAKSHKRTMPSGERIGRCIKYGKIKYPTEEDAHKDLKAFRKKVGPRLKSYLCPACGSWHNGHDRPPQFRRSRQKPAE